MNFLTRFGLDWSRLTVLLMLGLLLLGSILYSNFPKREDPEITIRTAMVTAQYPGMKPERMERLIAEPLEREIRTLAEIKEINTIIATGSVRIKATIKDEITELDTVFQDLRDSVDDAAREMPDGTRGPFVNTDYGEVSMASVAITAEGFSYRDMEITAKELQRRLYLVRGIAKVTLHGVQEERIWLEFNANRLATLGPQFFNLVEDIQLQNVILPSGSINAGGTDLSIETSGDFGSVDEIRNMLTQIAGMDDFVRVQDLMRVDRGYVSPKEDPVFYNNKPSIVLAVEMQGGFDIQAVGEDLSTAVRDFENTLPIGYELNFATYQPEKVTVAVNSAVSNVLQTFAVVLGVIMLFLGLRSGLIIASIVPFAILFALIGMSLLGIQLEQVSIAAIIISLGLLVDNGVVMVEDILGQIQKGVSARQAALNSGGQFAMPLMVSSLTTIFAFLPFFLMEGARGEYAFSLGAVVALTLIGSWISAMYFLPFIAATFIRPSEKSGTNTDSIFEKWKQIYLHYLHKGIQRPVAMIVSVYIIVALSLSLFSVPAQEMFPNSERNQVLIYMDLPRGTHIDETEAVAREVATWLTDSEINPNVRDHLLYIDNGGPRFYLALDPPDPNPAVGFFVVNTTTYEAALNFVERATPYLTSNHPEARFKLKLLSMGPGESGLVKIELAGPELDRLYDLAANVEDIFRAQAGMTQNENDWGNKILSTTIHVNQDRAQRLGLSSETLATNLSSYFDGFTISTYREDDQTVPIMARLAKTDRDSIEDLFSIIVGTDEEGNQVAIEQLAQLGPEIEYSTIRRKDQLRTIIVTAKSSVLAASDLLNAVQADLDQLDYSDGYFYTVGGESKDQGEVNEDLASGLPWAFIGMLTLIVFQFNSFRRALLVFMSIPLVMIGIPIGLILLHQPISFFGNLGIISLAGIVINNAIVLIDQIDIERKTHNLEAAIEAAASKRIRPILLTSATTVLGLLPLYLFGGPLWAPLAVVMMFGLAVASVITLVFVPAGYSLLFRNDNPYTERFITS